LHPHPINRETAEENLRFYFLVEITENTILWAIMPCGLEKAFSELHRITTQKIILFGCHCGNVKSNIRLLFSGK
jgi:hypothetical protein